MKRYLDYNEFCKFLEDLEEDKMTTVYTEDNDGNECENSSFMKINFNGNIAILFENAYGEVGILQDTHMMSYEDYAEDLFEYLEEEGRYRVYIEE